MQDISDQKGLSLDRLQTLCRVAADGGVMAASGGNPNKQSLYSRQLRELEAFFGVPLLDRSRTPHTLSEFGVRVEQAARGFLAEIAVLSSVQHTAAIPLRIGAGESVIQALLMPRLIPRLEGVRWVFCNMTGDAIVSALRSRRIDLGVAHAGRNYVGLKSFRLGYHGVHLIGSDPGLVHTSSVSWKDLRDFSLAVPEGDSDLRRELDATLKSSRHAPRVGVECTSYTQAIEAARNRGVVGVVPDYLAPQAKERGLFSIPLEELANFRRELRLLWHEASAEMKPKVEICVNLLKKGLLPTG